MVAESSSNEAFLTRTAFDGADGVSNNDEYDRDNDGVGPNGGSGSGNGSSRGSGGGGSGSAGGDDEGGGDGGGSGGKGTDDDGGSSKKGGTIDDDGEETTVKKSKVGPFGNLCSDNTTKSNGTNLTLTSGVGLKLLDMNYAQVKTDSGAKSDYKSTLLSSRTLETSALSDVKDGTYILVLCDASRMSTCNANSKLLSEFRSEGLEELENMRGGTLGVADRVVVSDGKVVSTGSAGLLLAKGESSPNCDANESPLVIDLAGDGVKMQAPKVRFDINGDGDLEETGWLDDAGAGFVAYDKNGNGKIDDAHELFGNNTLGPDGKKAANGFLALAKHDANADGVIDAQDSIYVDLKIWIDLDRDGDTDAGEMQSLSDAGVTSISVSYRNMYERDSHGNSTLQRSVATTTAGRKMVFDVWFMTRN
jgi:hypothetical protein